MSGRSGYEQAFSHVVVKFSLPLRPEVESQSVLPTLISICSMVYGEPVKEPMAWPSTVNPVKGSVPVHLVRWLAAISITASAELSLALRDLVTEFVQPW